MQKCPYCGTEYPDGLAVCPLDQTPFDKDYQPNLEPDEITPKSGSVGNAIGLIFLAWIISLLELVFLFFISVGAGLSDGSSPNLPRSVALTLGAGPVAVFIIAFSVLLHYAPRVTSWTLFLLIMLLMIPVLLSLGELFWALMIWMQSR